MRVILLILAAYAFVGWNDADAACQRFKPDGTVDIDYAWYVGKAENMLRDVGYYTLQG